MVEPRRAGWRVEPRAVLAALGSIRVAMALMALGILLVLAGTLAQVHADLWTVQQTYFRAWFAHVPSWHVVLPGGYLLGGAMVVNLVAATLRRPLRLTARHLGPFLAHAAIVLFLVGELGTSVLARETTMEITEGQTVRYSTSRRDVELAVVDVSPADHDRVVAVPARVLEAGAPVESPLLPFTIDVVRYLAASSVVAATPGARTIVTQGANAAWLAVPAPPSAGDAPDQPSAYVRLRRGEQVLATCLVSLLLPTPERVVVDGRTYLLSLRLRRFYEGFALTLIDFAHDRYTGTDVARNFSSRVRLADPTRGEDREVVISMNHPLRHDGAAFYQSAYKDGDTTTVLQVVRNPGWTLPYVALCVGTLGMVLFFGQALLRSLRSGDA